MRYGRYWYKSRREGGRVISEYIGTGDMGRLIAELENQQVQQRVQERAQRQALAAQEHEVDRTLDTITGQLHSLIEAALTVSGYHKHSGTWRRARA
jgi:hypothetical protein